MLLLVRAVALLVIPEKGGRLHGGTSVHPAALLSVFHASKQDNQQQRSHRMTGLRLVKHLTLSRE
ncbi:hypothetical protein [Lysobacter sp. Root494]|uniref:hypothetical protein n=1 Tax=Lysobacter sp. Root494 TaxID=1736549 RepID=UPI0012FAB26A|nr:hypothetical protein [Lysobacter sp. Root494]